MLVYADKENADTLMCSSRREVGRQVSDHATGESARPGAILHYRYDIRRSIQLTRKCAVHGRHVV